MTPTSLLLIAALFVPSAAGAVQAHAPETFSVRVSGEGPPVVLIPGLTSPPEVWDAAVAHLRTRYTCHVIGIAGFAGAPAVDGISLRRIRDELITYIGTQRLRRPALVGHSIGGLVAYWVAASIPDNIGAVVSIEGGTFVPALFNPSATVEGMRAEAEGMRGGIAKASAETFRAASDAQLAVQISDPQVRANVAERAALSDPATTGQLLYDLFTTDLRQEIAALRAPVLLLVGTAGIAPSAREAYVASARRQLAAAPDVTVTEVPGARHFVHLDAPREFLSLVDTFLTRVKP